VFSECFADYQRIDRDLLALAVKNTNIKAFALAFGPAAEAAQRSRVSSGALFGQACSFAAEDAAGSRPEPRRQSCASKPALRRTSRSKATRRWTSWRR